MAAHQNAFLEMKSENGGRFRLRGRGLRVNFQRRDLPRREQRKEITRDWLAHSPVRWR
jgi:hypothetical protein